MYYLPIVIVAYLLGRYHTAIRTWVLTMAETFTPELPDYSPVLCLDAHVRGIEHYAAWALPGEYLIRDNGQWRNVYLTRHARYLMGECPDGLVALTPARHISGIPARTPSGGQYIRRKTERVYRVSGLEVCHV